MEERRILLIGKTGDGKSSTGNTILRKKVFLSKASANSVTSKTVRKHGVVNGRKITVIDVPGFFDTDRNETEIKLEISKALIECSPCVHAIGIVIKVGRYTSHEGEVVQKLQDIMGEDAFKHAVVLFTFGEQLEGQTIKEFVKTNSKLQELVDKCGGRCHVIDNKHWNTNQSGDKSNRVQVKNLLDTIDKMVKENGCFTNELLQSLDKQIKKEVKINQENLSPEEKQEKAKKIVQDKFWKKLVGTGTGVIIGALLGVGVAVASLFLLVVGAAVKTGAAAAIKAGAAAAVKGGAAAAVKAGAAAAIKAGAAAAVKGGAAAAVKAGAAAAVKGGAAAAVKAGAAAAVKGGAAAAVKAGAAAAVKGGAAAVVETAVTGGAAAVVETAVTGGAAVVVETAVTGGAAAVVETAVTGGAAAVVETAVTGGAAAETGAAVGAAGTGTTIAAVVLGGAAVAGAVGGGITGWKAAEDAESVYDAMKKAAETNYDNAIYTLQKIKEFGEHAFDIQKMKKL